MQPSASTRAFTLIELLVVMTIICILASMTLPSLSRAKERALTIQCVNNLKQLGLAMLMYGDDNEERLPLAHGGVAWDDPKLVAWPKPIKSYYYATNLLNCPSLSRKYNQAQFSYFMGARAAFVDSHVPASVLLRRIRLPSQYILSGDSNFPFQVWDADQVNYTNDTLFADQYSPPPIHNQRVNVLFGDWHIDTCRKFKPEEMTYSYDVPGVEF